MEKNQLTNQRPIESDATHTIDAASDEQSVNAEPPAPLIHARRKKLWLVIAAVMLAAAAIILAVLVTRKPSSQAGRPVPAPSFEKDASPSGVASSGTSPRPGEIVVTLSPEQLESAQFKTAVATAPTGASAMPAGGLRTTGLVQANAYKEVPVMPITGGIVREVNVQLGDKVKQGQPLAIVFSTELADAQSEYLKLQAEVEEHHQRHKRTAELVEIGAASREEMEQVTSAYKSVQAKLSSTRQRLLLLGMTPPQINALGTPGAMSSLVQVSAPSTGTIISRTVNPGEVIAMGKELFRVADLATVWVIGQLYENDFASARMGAPVTMTTAAYPGRSFSGRISYIDPRVEPQTRTAQVRIEVANPGEMLKWGMFVDVSFGGATPTASGGSAVVVPRAALQNIGAKQVVFVVTDKPGVFAQREVTAGAEANGLVPVFSGLSAGERVVTDGSFLLRAESLKRNPQPVNISAPASAPAPASVINPPPLPKPEPQPSPTSAPQTEPTVQTAKVALTEQGYQPATIKLKRGVLARLTFIRQVEATCGTEIIIPAFNIKRELPYNEPVVIEFTPEKVGAFEFTCAMNMLKGKLIVK